MQFDALQQALLDSAGAELVSAMSAWRKENPDGTPDDFLKAINHDDQPRYR